MDILVANKVQLVEWLSADLFILQHAQQDGVINKRVYQDLAYTPKLTPGDVCIQLIDTIIYGGEETSAKFLQLLKKPEILELYPQLKEWDPSASPPRLSAVPGKKNKTLTLCTG